jgi:acetyl-CoA carboxylase biotin carboxyl carrier protein
MAGSKKAKLRGGGSGGSSVDLRELEQLLEFMGKHGLEEFEYERDTLRIRLKKASNNSGSVLRSAALVPEIVIAAPTAASPALSASPAAAAAGSGGARESSTAEPGRAEDLHMVKSPIVGTFYASPSPEADPFVRPGDRVKSGQVLCIIEAMKLMNEIESDVDGEVMRIFVENGQPVEYGEPLFGIHPHRKK